MASSCTQKVGIQLHLSVHYELYYLMCQALKAFTCSVDPTYCRFVAFLSELF
jgi:hypothetical protein